MPKKSNQKRADGRIAVQVFLGTVDGKRKYKTVYGVVCFKRLLNQSVRKSLKTYKPTILGKERIANEKKRENHAIV